MTERSRLVHGCPIYYGWVIFVVAIIGMVMTSPGQTDSVSIFIEHFINDLGLSRSVVSTLYTVATLIASVSLPFIGRQIDRRGHRAMVGVITVAFALALVYMGQVRGAAMLGIGFVAIRTLGQGSLELVSTNLLNQWWVRRRGMIIGIAGVLGGPLAGTFPNLIHALISRYVCRSLCSPRRRLERRLRPTVDPRPVDRTRAGPRRHREYHAPGFLTLAEAARQGPSHGPRLAIPYLTSTRQVCLSGHSTLNDRGLRSEIALPKP